MLFNQSVYVSGYSRGGGEAGRLNNAIAHPICPQDVLPPIDKAHGLVIAFNYIFDPGGQGLHDASLIQRGKDRTVDIGNRRQSIELTAQSSGHGVE